MAWLTNPRGRGPPPLKSCKKRGSPPALAAGIPGLWPSRTQERHQTPISRGWDGPRISRSYPGGHEASPTPQEHRGDLGGYPPGHRAHLGRSGARGWPSGEANSSDPTRRPGRLRDGPPGGRRHGVLAAAAGLRSPSQGGEPRNFAEFSAVRAVPGHLRGSGSLPASARSTQSLAAAYP